MKQQEVFKKIGVIIKELNDQYEYLKTIDGQLNELELELFIANSNFLTDHVVILNKLNAQLPPVPKPEQPVFEVKPPIIEEKPVVDEFFPVTEEKLAEEKPVAEEEPPVVEEKLLVEEWPPVTEEKLPLAEEKLEEWPHTPKEQIPVAELPEEKEPLPVHEPVYFEPVVQAINPATQSSYTEEEDKQPTPQIDLGAGSNEENYSYIRQDEAGTIRHELILDEADWGDEDETYETALKPAIEPIDEPIIEVPPAIAKPVVIENLEELRPVIEPAPQPVKDLPKEEMLTINERMSAQLKPGNVTEQIGAQKIDDLKQAINLNDKLLFIRDLFNGYSLAYSEAIEIMNRFSNFEEADTFLKKNYTVKNNWDSKPETTEKLYALLKRRYA